MTLWNILSWKSEVTSAFVLTSCFYMRSMLLEALLKNEVQERCMKLTPGSYVEIYGYYNGI